VLDIIVESSNGDIRSSVMALQFASVIEIGNKGRKRKSGEKGAAAVLESVTRREQSLVLFHLMGKVLYNKRIYSFARYSTYLSMSNLGKGDPPSASASARDIQREKAIDAQLKDPPKLPIYLQKHERRASRIDADVRRINLFVSAT
jgi:cell cycle checkpoint protein